MQRHQHPQFLLALLGQMEAAALDLAERLARTRADADRTITDSPDGSTGYRHVCAMGGGETITIRRVEQYNPLLGLQLEVRRGGRSRRIPEQPPFVPWNPSDEELAGSAREHAAAVLAALISP